MNALKRDGSRMAVGAVAFLVLVVYLSQFREALTDDAFITLQYSKNLLESARWGILPHHTSNSATSPLNVVLMTAVGAVTSDWPRAAVDFAAVCLTLILLLAMEISRILTGKASYGCIPAGMLALNPLVVSTIGLESILFVTLLTAVAYCLLCRKEAMLPALLALLTLTRPEGALLFLLLFVKTPGKFRFAAVYFTVLLPWYLFSWMYLGAALPDTLWIKTMQKWGPDAKLANGPLLYLQMYPAEAFLSFLSLLLAAPAAMAFFDETKGRRHSSLIVLLLSFGILHFAAYALLGVPPYHWYYVPSLGSITLAGWMAVLVLRESGFPIRRAAAKGLLIFFGVFPAIGMLWVCAVSNFRFAEPPIHTNWATQRQFQEMAGWIRENVSASESIALRGEIGTLAFYSDRLLLDYFSDRRILLEYLSRTAADRSAFGNAVLKWNFLLYDPDALLPPPKYELIAVADRDRYPDEGALQVWPTSTRWIPNGKWVLHRLETDR